MTAPNHALTGALVGLTIASPAVALPLAFLSHFVCDIVPHYDQAETDLVKRISSRQFIVDFLLISAAVCFLVVLLLTLARPTHWIQAVLCAFLAASPDLFWIRRFLHARRTGKDIALNPFLRFHEAIQWKTGPKFIWVEAVWFVVFGSLVAVRL